jgi:NAD(P)-dependent dehydrogenase (short-subunit alcohol dehydrogenase family)
MTAGPPPDAPAPDARADTRVPDGPLAGLTAVVTGGAGGIGQATVARLAAGGAAVASLDLVVRQETAERAGAAPGRPAAGPALTICADVTRVADLAAAARQVRDELGGCDILVLTAGVAVTGPAGTATETDWDRVFAVNVRGAWLSFREFLPVLRRPASVVTVASATGLRPLPGLAAYSAAKAALIGLTRSIAVDYAADQIRANCVCPGQVATPLAARVQAERPAGQRAAVASFADYPVKRAGQPEEVAAAISYLCQPEAGYVTGTVLAVDGGRSLH